MNKINFFFEDGVQIANFKKTIIRQGLKRIIENKERSFKLINFIFCSDTYLHQINVDFLQHDFLTDIITFDNSTSEEIEGDIYISVDRVRENAKILSVDLSDEFIRVISHGVLHLLGYKDKTSKDSTRMRKEEENCIKEIGVPRGTFK